MWLRPSYRPSPSSFVHGRKTASPATGMSTDNENQSAFRIIGEESGFQNPQDEKQDFTGSEGLPVETFDDHDV